MKNEVGIELIELLKAEVERAFAHRLETSNDFDKLSECIREKTGQTLSESTLKRIWGYVTYCPRPHTSSLDVLAQYVGYKSVAEFQKQQQNSEFFASEKISTAELNQGAVIIIGWMPDRTVKLEYLEGYKFRIVDGGKSKLKKDDIVETLAFTKGQPLYFEKVTRDGKELPSYIAGKSAGITTLKREN